MPMPVEAFFEHNVWATVGLLEACRELSEEQLDAASADGYGSMWETLVHLVAAEQRYIRRLGADPGAEAVVEGDRPRLDTLKRAAQANGEALVNLALSTGPASIATGATEYGLAFETQPAVFLVQVVNHSTEHRTQVMGLMSRLGVGPRDLDEHLDAWAWGVATGALRTKPV
jgi:uncharacterized damage-inducible protein DinB